MIIEINQLIGLNKLQYQNMVAKYFNQWCEQLSHIRYVPMRDFQNNSQLFNWYAQQWERYMVTPFLEENKGCIKDGLRDTKLYFDLFISIVDSKDNKMNAIYPSTIVKTIKNQHYKSINKK